MNCLEGKRGRRGGGTMHCTRWAVLGEGPLRALPRGRKPDRPHSAAAQRQHAAPI